MDNKKIFSKFLTFLNELNEIFGSKHNSVFLYYKLCKKTSISNDTGLSKHIEYLKRFLLPNSDFIVKQQWQSLSPNEIRFDVSEKVHIPFQYLFKETDKETRQAMFKHLQLLLLMVVSEDQRVSIREALKMPVETPSSNKEEDFLNKFVEKVEEKFKNGSASSQANPMEAAMNLLKSGVLTDMTSSMKRDIESGNLDVNKLVGNIQQMIGKLSDGNPNVPDFSSMISSLSGNVSSNSSDTQVSESSSAHFDPSSLMTMASSLLGSTNASSTGFDPSSLMSMASGLLGQNGSNGFDPSAILKMLSAQDATSQSESEFDPSSILKNLMNGGNMDFLKGMLSASGINLSNLFNETGGIDIDKALEMASGFIPSLAAVKDMIPRNAEGKIDINEVKETVTQMLPRSADGNIDPLGALNILKGFLPEGSMENFDISSILEMVKNFNLN
jgi:hypothetical protein